MGLRYEDLEEMCHTLGDKISEANEKLRSTRGDLTGGDLTYIDTLSHALKSIKTIMAMEEGGYSHNMGYSGYSENDGYNGDYSGRYYPGSSYARNRRRDSMGRYSRRGYSRAADDVVEQLRDVMDSSTDERAKQEIQKLISKMEG